MRSVERRTKTDETRERTSDHLTVKEAILSAAALSPFPRRKAIVVVAPTLSPIPI